MLRGVIGFVAVASVGLAGYNFLLWRDARPCVKPITYSIDSFDARFDLSRERFSSALSQAESIWESAIGKELFTHLPEKGKLAVNLIYDYRQEVTEELSLIESVVKTGEATYDALNEKYRLLKSDYTELKRSYDVAVTLFNQKSAEYEQSVEKWNRGRRSSKEEFEALEAKRRALESELNSLKAFEARLNGLVQEINTTVVKLNALAQDLNLNVEEYNTIGASRGDTFAGGVYTSEAGEERIDIFEFENEEKLVRVLAHELGHALGLEHVDDQQAIMYYLNQGEASKLSSADLNALKLLCGVQ